MGADDEAGFRVLFDHHFADLWRFARRRVSSADDADDVAAETFAVAWRRRDQLPHGDDVRLWLFGVARNVTVDIWVADGLIRRLDVASPDYGSHSIEYYDFNADITITPPPGPYVESSVVG